MFGIQHYIGFLVFHSAVSRVDFVHCGQEPLGERVLLCKQIKLSSGLGQGVKNAIRLSQQKGAAKKKDRFTSCVSYWTIIQEKVDQFQ